MRKRFFKIIIVTAVLMFGGMVHAKTSADYKAGYNDGCTSSKGHYTRSRYKYAHSSRYHSGWLKGKRACKRHVKRKKRVRHHVKKSYTKSCNTEVPWEAFRRGWSHGYRSAKGRFYVDRRGCADYRRGWVSGYRACHCGDLKKPDSYAEGYYRGCSSTFNIKIRDDLYYGASTGYRHGWKQGYRDCRGIYR